MVGHIDGTCPATPKNQVDRSSLGRIAGHRAAGERLQCAVGTHGEGKNLSRGSSCGQRFIVQDVDLAAGGNDRRALAHRVAHAVGDDLRRALGQRELSTAGVIGVGIDSLSSCRRVRGRLAS